MKTKRGLPLQGNPITSPSHTLSQLIVFSHTEEKLQELAVETKVELVNSQSDGSGPSLDQFSISDFYYNDLDETWNIDYMIQVSDDLSGFQAGHIVEFTSPTGKSLQESRDLQVDGTLSTTRSFSKHIASGEYTINTIRLYDNAGNDGWVYGRDLSALGLPSILTLDNPFGDEELPELLNFNLEASFHPVSLRPSILFDFIAQDIGTGYKNA
jgi:hypothetical protein